MKKLIKLVMVAFLAVGFLGTSLNADVTKGQKIIIKKLKKSCGFNGAVLAKKHTQDEWTTVFKAGNLNSEIKNLCPKSRPLKEKYLPHVFDFLNNFASDSGNVPSC